MGRISFTVLALTLCVGPTVGDGASAQQSNDFVDNIRDELVRKGVMTDIEASRIRRGRSAVEQINYLEDRGLITPREAASFRSGGRPLAQFTPLERIVPPPPTLPQPLIAPQKQAGASDCEAEKKYATQIQTSVNDTARRLAMQRRNEARGRCAEFTAAQDDAQAAQRRYEEGMRRMAWKTYGNVSIPWSLWKEVSPGKRSNGFIRHSRVEEDPKESTAILMINTTSDHTYAPSGISISCATATYSLNVSDSLGAPPWTQRQASWTVWKAPEEGTAWEKVLLDLCSNVLPSNRPATKFDPD